MVTGSEMISPAGPETPSRAELPYRLRQQALLGDFGRFALQTREFGKILQRATELCSQGLETPFSKVLEYLASEKRLLVRAGVGWRPGVVGHVTLSADTSSPAGYAFQTGSTVISNDLKGETRFRTPPLLVEHGIRRAVNVLIRWGNDTDAPFGVLEVDSPGGALFDADDGQFLANFASLLGIAIERQQADAQLQTAVEHQALLTREMSHRVKNSLASVIAMLRVQARGGLSEEVRSALGDAASRVATIAEVHDHLWRGAEIGFVDLAEFINGLCTKLQETAGHNSITVRADKVSLAADTAIPLGLLVNELVTNAIKYAYPGSRGPIEVTAVMRSGGLHVSISDQGVGMPDNFDIDLPRASMGIRVIKGLVQQLNAKLTVSANVPKGAVFVVETPLPA